MSRVYHFDINGTIIGTDSTDNASVQEAASESFSRSINLAGEICKESEISYYTHVKDSDKDYKTKIYGFIDQFPQHKAQYDTLVEAFKSGLFKSFLKLVDTEFKSNKSLLVLRTFGKDTESIVSLLKSYNMTFVSYKSEQLNDELYNSCHKQGVHIRVQDDYHKWNSNGRTAAFGKQIKSFQGIVQYAFDDNFCMNCGDDVKFHHVNTLLAALDENYYSNVVAQWV